MMKKLLILVLIIAVMTITFYFTVMNRTEEPAEKKPEEVSLVPVKTKTVNFKDNKKQVSLKIPQIETEDVSFNLYSNNRINEELDVDKVYDEFTAGMEESQIGFFTYEADFVRNDCYDFLSLVATQRIQLGSDRSITRKRAFNYNIKFNRTADLKDIFSNKGMYKKKILDNVLSQAKQQGIELKEDGIFLTISDLQPFFIQNNKLFILFEAGEIAAVSFGELVFEMPFEMENGLFVY